MHLKAATNLVRKQTLKNNRSQNKFRKNNKFQIATNFKKTTDFGFVLSHPYRFCIISWPIGRPSAERRGVQGGDPPAKAKRRLLKYLKKGNYNLVATNWVGPKQQKITKNNRFEKLLISKISNYRKHYISKTTTNEENSNFQKTTNFEQEA